MIKLAILQADVHESGYFHKIGMDTTALAKIMHMGH